MVPGHNCCKKVYVATSRDAELDSPPPRGTELITTALKPGRGPAAGEKEKVEEGGLPGWVGG